MVLAVVLDQQEAEEVDQSNFQKEIEQLSELEAQNILLQELDNMNF
ncbi:MAG: hypothetical protein F6K26_21350 [Moorea sp. SIO2I5]|nr:hypothetical protein [Moorena sp. SIO2I5]